MREFATESGEKVIEPSSSFLDKCKKENKKPAKMMASLFYNQKIQFTF